MQLSQNFNMSEFEESPTANRLDIDNSIPTELTGNIKLLVNYVLQPVRTFINTSISITSGYRCPELNKQIGGAPTSQHQKAEAADFVCVNKSIAFNYIRDNCVFDQLIYEFGDHIQPAWIHVSYDSLGNNRGEVLKAYKKNGKTKYIRM